MAHQPRLDSLTERERETAIRAARTMGLNIAGVDLLRSRRGPLVLEVNSSPGLEGIEGASKVDVADSIIEYIEARLRRRQKPKLAVVARRKA